MTKRLAVSLFVLLFAAALLPAQQQVTALMDEATTQIGAPLHQRILSPLEGTGGTPVHPVYFEHRRPKAGCLETAKCGELLEHGWTHNLRTSAGTTGQYNQLFGTAAAVYTYIGLTNSAITPAMADTTLSGEISSNGLSRANSTPTNASTTLSVPGAPTLVVTGGSGGTAQYYFVFACNQGICTTVGTVSASATPNATLDTTHYITGTFTGQLGASSYVIVRSNSNSAPSGSLAGGATQTSTGQVGSPAIACTTSGTTVTCTFVDASNTLAAYTVPASNLTNYGKATLVYTWTATGTQSAQAFGVFNASSSGTMIFEGTFTQVSLNTSDTFQLTETVYF